MAYSVADRRRAERLFVERGMTVEQVAAEMGVARSTLLRWSSRCEWSELRRLRSKLERETLAMATELAAAARESTDPQQAFAAQRAIALAGFGGNPVETDYPPPAEVATAILDVLGNHIEIGPLVRRHKNEVIRLTLAALKQFQQSEQAR